MSIILASNKCLQKFEHVHLQTSQLKVEWLLSLANKNLDLGHGVPFKRVNNSTIVVKILLWEDN